MDEAGKKICEMQEVRIVVEHIHVYRYPKWRLRMPKVYIRAKKKKTGRWAYKLWTQVVCAVAALAVAFEAYIIMLPVVYAERAGQAAIGGECLAMVLAGVATYGILIRAMSDKQKGERKCVAQKR